MSIAQVCDYCIACHTAADRRNGMSDAVLGELIAVVGMAVETNRLAQARRVPVDEAFEQASVGACRPAGDAGSL